MKKRSGYVVMKKLIGLVKPLMGFMIMAILMGLIGHLCATFITIFGGYAVLSLLGFEVPFSITVIFVSVMVFALIRGVLRYAEQSCNHFIAFKLLALIRDKVFQALRKLCPAKLEGKEKGNLISIITSDIELLEVFYAHTISPVVIAFLFSCLMCVYIGSYHIALGVVAFLAYVVVGVVIPIVTSRFSGEVGLRFRSQSGELSGYVLDSIRGVSEILQFAREESRIEKMNQKTKQLSMEEEQMKRISGRNMAVTNTIIFIFDLVMFFVAILLYQREMLSFDGVLIPTMALMSSYGPVVALANLGSTLQNTFAAGNRVLDILEDVPVVEEIQGKDEVDFTGAGVRNITFCYSDEVILNDVTLDIPKGKIIGLTGRSGSGKSTLLKLFMRFWDVKNGNVQISNTDIREINTENLRNMESFMTQETHLFHDSIEKNIRIAKLDATHEEIEEACKKASVHDFIMSLPNGYDTTVGELGDTLSGGEKQRIGLARAFLHDASLILLDEPTSNLDSLNEAVILKSLKEEGKEKTIILVSHRASTMRIADTVYSVEELSKTGRVS